MIRIYRDKKVVSVRFVRFSCAAEANEEEGRHQKVSYALPTMAVPTTRK
jgi:hypothetical protein